MVLVFNGVSNTVKYFGTIWMTIHYDVQLFHSWYSLNDLTRLQLVYGTFAEVQGRFFWTSFNSIVLVEVQKGTKFWNSFTLLSRRL